MKKLQPNSTFWNKYRYKHLTYFVVSVLTVVFLMRFQFFHDSLLWVAGTGYIGAFVGGMLYVSTFTAAIGILILLYLAETTPILPLSLVAGVGGVVGDFVIFKLIRTSLKEELNSLYYKLGGMYISRLFTKKSPLGWMLPVLGAVVIASPLPDEIGVSMIGVSKMTTTNFLILSLFLDCIGICLLVFFAAGTV